jgi:hypothetical protein
MPVLGIVASQISGHLFAPSGAYDSIATVNVSSATSSITFSSIPSTYTHLQLRGISRSSSGNNYDNLIIGFNSDTGANYASHYLAGNGATADSYAWTSDTAIRSFYTSGGGAISGVFAASVIDILDYANTSKFKTTRQLNGFDNNGTGTSNYDKGTVDLSSGLWRSTSAISSINLQINAGVNFTQYSQFALYGIKGGN